MRIAYLTNVYPKLSHSFIRREIAGVEAAGAEVVRLSIRPVDEVLEGEADRREERATTAILGLGWARLAGSVAGALARRPPAALRSLACAVRLGWRSDVGVPRHVAYWIEACALARILERRGVEHLHVHFGTNAATVALLAHEMGSVPYSLTVHGQIEFDSPAQIHLGAKVAAARLVATISSYARGQVCRWSRVEDWPKVHVIHCGVDGGFLDAPVVPVPPEPRLLAVGRLS